jgi:hypothetical protein
MTHNGGHIDVCFGYGHAGFDFAVWSFSKHALILILLDT